MTDTHRSKLDVLFWAMLEFIIIITLLAVVTASLGQIP